MWLLLLPSEAGCSEPAVTYFCAVPWRQAGDAELVSRPRSAALCQITKPIVPLGRVMVVAKWLLLRPKHLTLCGCAAQRELHWLCRQVITEACSSSLGAFDGISAQLCPVCSLCTAGFPCTCVIFKDGVGKALQNGRGNAIPCLEVQPTYLGKRKPLLIL